VAACRTACLFIGSVQQPRTGIAVTWNGAELNALRRRRGESLAFMYQEVRRLMTLAYPGQKGDLWEAMARDAFVGALGDLNTGS